MDSEGQLVKIYQIYLITIGKRVKTETFEYLAREYGSIKSIALIFHDRDVTSDGNQKGLHCHMVLEFRNPLSITSLENLSSLVGKSLNNQDLMFQSRNVEVSKSSW